MKYKFLGFILCISQSILLFADENCVYINSQGVIKSVKSQSEIPKEFIAQSRCQKIEKGNFLAKPEEIELSGTTRREEINSPVGKISLRWPRSTEGLFGRTPVRAMVEASKIVNRVIRSSSFPAEIQNMNLDWNVIFMDENLPESQIPSNLISNCHPGWMTPPSNIYIVAQRVAAGCGGPKSTISEADKQLTEVLVHEMGHALEFYMLPKHNSMDRMRAEGFATWFEMHAAQYSSLMNKKELTKRTANMALMAIQNSPTSFSFSGSGPDYARASMYFSAVENKQGLRGIISIYESMNNEGLDLFSAIEKKSNLKKDLLEKEVLKFIESNK